MKKSETLELTELCQINRSAEVRADSVDVEKRTVEVIFSTGSRVKRGGFFTEPFLEELSMEKKAVRLKRLRNGAPVLNNHSSFGGLENVLGVVENPSVDGERGTATLRFSNRESVRDIFNDIENKILRNVSVGYRVHKFEEVGESDGIKILRAIDWEPMEISIVPIGADAGANIRNENVIEKFPCEILKRTSEEGNSTMIKKQKRNEGEDGGEEKDAENQPEQTDPTSSEPAKEEPKQEDAESDKEAKGERDGSLLDMEKEKVIVAERQRAAEIYNLCEKSGMTRSFGDTLVKDGKNLDEVRTLIIDNLHSEDVKIKSRNITIESGSYDEKEVHERGITNAIMNRGMAGRYPLSDEGKMFRGCTLMELAKKTLEIEGVRTAGMSKMEVASRALHSSDDFPKLLENIVTKTLQQAFEEEPQTFSFMTRSVELPDFKDKSAVKLGDAEDLVEVPETGEISRGTISEAGEKYRLKDYAKIMAFSRKMLINDDADALSQIPAKMGRASKRLESDLVWEIINLNLPVEGAPLFDAAHNNLLTAALLSVTSLGAARSAMRKQRSLDGKPMNLSAGWLVVPPDLETLADQLVTQVTARKADDVNPFGGRLKAVSESRLSEGPSGSDIAWYVMTSTNEIDMIELGTLSGQSGPSMETRNGFEVLGMEFRILHSVAAKVVEHRGFQKNPGL